MKRKPKRLHFFKEEPSIIKLPEVIRSSEIMKNIAFFGDDKSTIYSVNFEEETVIDKITLEEKNDNETNYMTQVICIIYVERESKDYVLVQLRSGRIYIVEVNSFFHFISYKILINFSQIGFTKMCLSMCNNFIITGGSDDTCELSIYNIRDVNNVGTYQHKFGEDNDKLGSLTIIKPLSYMSDNSYIIGLEGGSILLVDIFENNINSKFSIKESNEVNKGKKSKFTKIIESSFHEGTLEPISHEFTILPVDSLMNIVKDSTILNIIQIYKNHDKITICVSFYSDSLILLNIVNNKFIEDSLKIINNVCSHIKIGLPCLTSYNNLLFTGGFDGRIRSYDYREESNSIELVEWINISHSINNIILTNSSVSKRTFLIVTSEDKLINIFYLK